MKIGIVVLVLAIFLVNNLVLAGDTLYLAVSMGAKSFMPRNFRTVLTKYRKELVKGTLLKSPRGETWSRLLVQDKHKAALLVEQEAVYIINSIRSQKHFGIVTYHFGVISHYLTDMGMPFRYHSSELNRMIGHEFDYLMEEKIHKFRIVFNGYDNIAKERNSFSNKAYGMSYKKTKFENQLMGIFMDNGVVKSYTSFDDRSIPFGIGSIVYSRVINDVVDVWYSIWEIAGGDVTRKPFELN